MSTASSVLVLFTLIFLFNSLGLIKLTRTLGYLLRLLASTVLHLICLDLRRFVSFIKLRLWRQFGLSI
jgi:hypothetical protein